jgi:hypothetical protein
MIFFCRNNIAAAADAEVADASENNIKNQKKKQLFDFLAILFDIVNKK